MFLAALLDLGLSRRELEQDLAGLGLDFALRVARVQRGALAARYLEVRLPQRGRAARTASRRGAAAARSARSAGHAHTPEHGHGHAHAPEHGHPPSSAGASSAARRGHAHRSYREIVAILTRAKLERGVRERALATFEALARAEARVHGRRIDDVHFHEVGAVDAIVDITGAAIGLARLGIASVSASPVALGHGTVESEHGRLPLPAPATLELLRGIPVVPAPVAWETVTPTGAALLRTLVDDFVPLPPMSIDAIGHGAGDDRPGPLPNVLRALLGRGAALSSDRVCVLETNLDDFVPQHFDDLMERLFEAGALDVSVQPLQMKKNRPGHLLRVVARPSERAPLAALILGESTALGVRTHDCDRFVLEREIGRVETRFGPVRVKYAVDPQGRRRAAPEYDDCKRLARRAGVPLREVVRAAERAADEG